VPGANGTVGAELAERAADAITAADVLLLQGEVAPDASARAAAIARDAGVTVIVNTAPVSEGTDLVLAHASVVVANLEEARTLNLVAGETVVITHGAAGAEVAGVIVPAFPATVVDPTGAGDAFCGALAVALGEGRDLVAAVRFANAAGACAVAVAGAEPSLPTRAAVEAVLAAGAGPAGPTRR
jgi:ribokinase